MLVIADTYLHIIQQTDAHLGQALIDKALLIAGE
jgi:hypothetical protein